MLLKFTSSKFSQHDIVDLCNIFGIQDHSTCISSSYVKVTVPFIEKVFIINVRANVTLVVVC